MACELCGGTGTRNVVVTHSFTKLPKLVVEPCECFTSQMVSSEQKLLHHLQDQYMSPADLDDTFNLEPDNSQKSKYLLITGNWNAFLLMVKAILMKDRFNLDKPRILFATSIDVVHEYHVPQDDGTSLHLSALEAFDLVILVFGSSEVNKAIAPSMAQIVKTRVECSKPVWIYFRESMLSFSPDHQEYSSELAGVLETKFKKVNIKSDLKIEARKSASKKMAEKFNL